MECTCYTYGDAALHLNPCPLHERWARAIRAVAVHDERERCCEIVYGQAGSDNAAERTVRAIREST